MSRGKKGAGRPDEPTSKLAAQHQGNPEQALRSRAEALLRAGTSAHPAPPRSPSRADSQRTLHELQVHQVELEVQNEELRRVQVELEAARSRYFDLYDLAPVGYLTVSEKDRILEANLAATLLLGVHRSALVQLPLASFIDPQDVDLQYLQLRKLFTTGAPRTFEMRLRRPDGTAVWCWVGTTLGKDADGSRVCRMVISDISERREGEVARHALEDQLRESQKMEAIGTLAGGLSHELNNYLGVIVGNVELAMLRAEEAPRVGAILEEIRTAGERARSLVRQIVSFSRRQPTDLRAMSLATVVADSLRLLRATLPAEVTLGWAAEADFPAVLGDPMQVEQVLLNLGTNAAHAMKGRPGRIDVEVAVVTLAPDAPLPHPDLHPGRHVRVSVSDDGEGMDEATMRRIFEPFFTTKSLGEGSGLGLSVAHGIMRAHHGAITVQSTPGKGSRFQLYVPAISSPAPATVSPEPSEAVPAGRGERILFIDDEDATVNVYRALLEQRGYRVTGCTDPREALALLRRAPADFDVVVTDHSMPAMSGLSLARAVRKLRPDLPIVLSSGHVMDSVRAEADAAGVSALIGKPYRTVEMCAVLGSVLSRPPD